MKIAEKPLLKITKAWLADATRVVKERLPGAFQSLVNLVPNLSDGIGRIRTGYEIYDVSHGGITIPTGTEILITKPIQNPQDDDEHLYFTDNSDKRIWISPHYIGTSRNTEIIPLDYQLLVTDTFTMPTANQMQWASAPAGYNTATSYYNGWSVRNITQGETAQVKTSTGGASPILTLVEDVDATGLNWTGTDDIVLYWNFHENIPAIKVFTGAAGSVSSTQVIITGSDALGLSSTDDFYDGWTLVNVTQTERLLISDYQYDAAAAGTSTFTLSGNPSTLSWVVTNTYLIRYFAPTYNDDKANPPTVNAENSILRLSGGQGTTRGLRGIHITPRLTRSFLPSHTRTLAFDGTYAAERECKSETDVLGSTKFTMSNGGFLEERGDPVYAFASGAAGAGTWTQTGGTAGQLHTAIDDGPSTNDADYLTAASTQTALGFNTGLQIEFAPLTHLLHNQGTLTITFRYRVNSTASLRVQLFIARGGANLEFSATDYLSLGVAGFTTQTIVINNSALGDLASIQKFMIRFDRANASTNAVDLAWMKLDYQYVDPEAVALPTAKTYWLATALIYDGFQIGKPTKWETVSDYSVASGHWTNNYLPDGTGGLTVNLSFSLATLNKRVTGIRIYIAQDDGQATVRKNPYQYLATVSLTQADKYASGWTFTGSTGRFTQSIVVDGNLFGIGGETFQTDSGYNIDTPDIMYAYSTEEIVSSRRLIANAYIVSQTMVDRDHVFTNPVGGAVDLNSGVIQPDIFSNEEGVYLLRVDPMVGTKVNAIIPSGVDEFIVLKERGVIRARIVVIGQLIDLVQTIESKDVGASTVNGWTKDDVGIIYFPGYDDIYAFREGNLTPIIERPDKNDWLDTYRTPSKISSANKESATVVYLPELKSVLFLFDNTKASVDFTDKQYLFHQGLWSKISLKETAFAGVPTLSFRWVTQLRNGHILGTSTETSPNTYRLTRSYSAGAYPFTYSDNGTAIVPHFNTGDLLFDGESVEALLSKVVINRSFKDSAGASSTMTGNLEVDIKNENAEGLDTTAQSVSATRLVLKFTPYVKRVGQSFKIEYNNAASSRERLSSGSVFQIASVEYFGRTRPRVSRSGE